MKRFLCLMLCAALALGCAGAWAEGEPEAPETHELTASSFPLYTNNGKSSYELRLYFVNGVFNAIMVKGNAVGDLDRPGHIQYLRMILDDIRRDAAAV